MSGPLVVLVGPPGSGKTSVGRRLAKVLGVAFRDTDADVVAAAGKSIPDIFVADGEEAFRAFERAAVARAVAEHDGVLALGGGAVLAAETRALLRGVPTVHLSVGMTDGLRRVGLARDRPVLALNPRAQYRHLLAQREPLYREVAAATVVTDGKGVAQVVREVREAVAGLAERRVTVGGGQPYEVVIGRGLTPLVAAALPGADRVAVLFQDVAAVRARAEEVAGQLRDRTVLPVPLPASEDGKTVTTAQACWDALGAAGFTRSDAVVGVGGGAATDVAGFVAACWLRGVRSVLVPTTLLGMVDAAVGGKTGVNTAAGKNLVGAFHPPAAVLCDLDALATLPEAEVAAGLAEVAKCGFIADTGILDVVGRRDLLPELVERAVRVKADVVSADLREGGLREILNYGHTLGHAIERVEGYRVRHGEAISVGMVFAAELAHRAGRLDAAAVARHREVLGGLGLPTTYAGELPPLLAAMALDKKARGSLLRFVVLDGIGRPGRLEGPDEALLRSAYAAVHDPEGWPR